MVPRPALSLALAAIPGLAARAGVEWAAAAGFRAVQLDAADLRARTLDRSARRDIAALLRRGELTLSGLDLLIPPAHFTNPAHADRALAAALGAVQLAADLAALSASGPAVLCLALGEEGAPAGPEAVAPLLARAGTCGVAIADLGPVWAAAAEPHPRSPLGAAIDPAALLMRGGDPAAAAARAGAALVQARLSDWSGAARCAPGAGRLDELSYLVALSTARHHRPLVLDLRGVPNPTAVARNVLGAWA